jgi:hypothetical protein
LLRDIHVFCQFGSQFAPAMNQDFPSLQLRKRQKKRSELARIIDDITANLYDKKFFHSFTG